MDLIIRKNYFLFLVICLIGFVYSGTVYSAKCESKFPKKLSNEQIKLIFSNPESYRGEKGCTRFSKKYFNGDKQVASDRVLSVLGKKKFKELGWPTEFQKDIHQRTRDRILNSKNNIKNEYNRMEGCVRYAEKYSAGDMSKAYTEVLAALGKKKIEEMEWRQFQGTTKEFKAVKSKILSSGGSVKNEYKNKTGHARLANEIFDGNKAKTYINVLAVLGRKLFNELNWNYPR